MSSIFSSHSKSTHSSNFADSFIKNHSVSIRNTNHYNQKNYNKDDSCNHMNNVHYSFKLRNFIIQSFYTVFNSIPNNILACKLLINSFTNVTRICFKCFCTGTYIVTILANKLFKFVGNLCLFLFVFKLNGKS